MQSGARAASALLLLCLSSSFATLAACRSEPACGRRDDRSVVACLDNLAVTTTEVAEHLRPVPPIAGQAAPPDPRQRALEAALRVRLFADEASRRKLDAPGTEGGATRRRSALYQALIRDENGKLGAVPEQIPEEEARAYYQAQPHKLNKVTSVYVRGILVADAARAEELYRKAVGLDELGFADLAKASSEDPSAAEGGDLGEMHAEGVDPVLTRLSNDLRGAGALGGPVRLSDGRYAILRVSAIDMIVKPFDDLMTRRVKNLIAREREEAGLDALYTRLRGAHRVEVFADELRTLPDPVPAAPAAAADPDQ